MCSTFNSHFNIDFLSVKSFDEDIKDKKQLNGTEVYGMPFNCIDKFNQISYDNNIMGNYNIFDQNFKFWDANSIWKTITMILSLITILILMMISFV